MSKNRSIRIIVFLGLLTALSIVLTRLLSVTLTGYLRVSLGNLPIILAGVWFGPFAGAVVGAVADIVGAITLSPFGWSPWITPGAVLTGLIPGLIAWYVFKGKLSLTHFFVITGVTDIVASICCTTICMHYAFAFPIEVMILPRAGLYIALAAVEAPIAYVLYKIAYLRSLQQNLVSLRKAKK